MVHALVLQAIDVNAGNRIVQFAAILLELGGALLIALLFAIIRRSSIHRAYFSTWTLAWYAMVVGTEFFPEHGESAELPLILTLREVVLCPRGHSS